MTVLSKADPYPMEDGRRGKLSRETSSYLGRHGAGGAMGQAEIVWAEWKMRPKARK